MESSPTDSPSLQICSTPSPSLAYSQTWASFFILSATSWSCCPYTYSLLSLLQPTRTASDLRPRGTSWPRWTSLSSFWSFSSQPLALASILCITRMRVCWSPCPVHALSGGIQSNIMLNLESNSWMTICVRPSSCPLMLSRSMSRWLLLALALIPCWCLEPWRSSKAISVLSLFSFPFSVENPTSNTYFVSDKKRVWGRTLQVCVLSLISLLIPFFNIIINVNILFNAPLFLWPSFP